MNIVLVCINNFQEHILTNIKQLIRLNHKKIFIITNKQFFDCFSLYIENIILIAYDNLYDSFNFSEESSLDNSFRGGFWKLTSQRFFVIYEFMKKYNINNVLHIENDVLIYYNSDELEKYIDKKYMYIPFDSYYRNIASIVFFSDINIFKQILDYYDFNKNDMENFALINKKTGLIKHFPIFKQEYANNDEELFISSNSNIFPFIFDAAAIGQYLGGVDPRNINGNTEGFVNETCVIKYNKYNFLFKIIDGIKKPYIIIDNKEIPIFNLHIHCKNLQKYIIE